VAEVGVTTKPLETDVRPALGAEAGPPELPPQLRVVYLPLYRILKPLFRLYFGMRGEGLEHLPSGGRYLIASNHLSMLDWAFLWYYLPLSTRFVIGRIHDQVPIRVLCRIIGPVPLSASEFDLAGSRPAHAVLSTGGPLVVFPEGGISRSGRPQLGRPGIIRLAAAAQVPIVPVALRGPAGALPLGSFVPRPGRVAAAFGPPLPPPPPTLDRDAEIALANRLMLHITALLDGTSLPPPGWG
jgi:1-acyl-sn-glycerol-3-phosphate acyltransferase